MKVSLIQTRQMFQSLEKIACFIKTPITNLFFFYFRLNFLNNHNKKDGSFIWSKSVQGFILASYFWGYILTQVFFW